MDLRVEIFYVVSKSKLPKGMSFPLKRSEFDSAMSTIAYDGIRFVYFNLGQRSSGKSILMHCDAKCIILYAVPSAERQRIGEALLNEGFPKLRRWLENIGKTETARMMKHYFGMRWVDGRLVVHAE